MCEYRGYSAKRKPEDRVLWPWTRLTNSESPETGCENWDFHHSPWMRKADENKSYHTWADLFTCHPGEAESGPNIPPAQVGPEMETSKQDECLGLMERNRGCGSGLRKTQSPEGPGFASVYPSDVSPPYHDICYTIG
ncbi:hypothetical protein CapIbe_017842 [Capra ibex]